MYIFTVDLKNVEKFEMVGDQWTVGDGQERKRVVVVGDLRKLASELVAEQDNLWYGFWHFCVSA